jgi:sulfur transfer complex TusBCD TusB component (DsrH family)
MNNDETYLGDGVYASHDGFQVWLAVNHHENKVVALDPDVFARLCKYFEMLKEKKNV